VNVNTKDTSLQINKIYYGHKKIYDTGLRGDIINCHSKIILYMGGGGLSFKKASVKCPDCL
jgi:hypothetical protein